MILIDGGQEGYQLFKNHEEMDAFYNKNEKLITTNMENTIEKFAIGTIVYLKSGSPAMTVSEYYKEYSTNIETGGVSCHWFWEDKVHQYLFQHDELTATNPHKNY